MKERVYEKSMSDTDLLAGWIRFPKNHPRYSGRVKLHRSKDKFSVEMDCQSVKSGTYIYDCRPCESMRVFRDVMELETGNGDK